MPFKLNMSSLSLTFKILKDQIVIYGMDVMGLIRLRLNSNESEIVKFFF